MLGLAFGLTFIKKIKRKFGIFFLFKPRCRLIRQGIIQRVVMPYLYWYDAFVYLLSR